MKNLIIITLLASTLALTGCATVNPGERGVRTTMGVVDKHLNEPGMVTYNPFTDHIDIYSVKQVTVEGQATPLTSDQQPLSITFKVQYSLPESQILDIYQNIKGDPYETLVSPQIQEAFRQVVSQYKADAVIGGVNKIKDQVLYAVRKTLKNKVYVADIPITHIDLPAALQQAVIEKQQMEISAKKKQYELEKEKREAEITVTKAKAQAESIRLQSQALSNSPKLVELKWVEKWDGKLPEVMSGSNSLIVSPRK